MKRDTIKTSAKTPPDLVLALELEYIALDGRAIEYEAVKSVLKSMDIEISPAIFSRYCLHYPPSQYLARMRGGFLKGAPTAAKGEDLATAILSAYSSRKPQMRPALKKLTAAAVDKGCRIGVLSHLPEPAAKELAAAVGLGGEECVLTSAGSEPLQTGWGRIVKLANSMPGRSVALVSSGNAMRGAVRAGLRCVAIPDRFCAHEDFGGADRVVDSLEDLRIGDILSLVDLGD